MTVDKHKMFEDFVASADWLRARPDCTDKIGALGFCFGGATVNTLAPPGSRISRLWFLSTAGSPRLRTPLISRRRFCCTTQAWTRASTVAGPPGKKR